MAFTITVRAERADNYLIDPNMSLKAKGLLSLIHQIRERTQLSEIMAMCGEEELEVYRAFGELMKLGYLEIVQFKTEDGGTGNEYVVWDTPVAKED